MPRRLLFQGKDEAKVQQLLTPSRTESRTKSTGPLEIRRLLGKRRSLAYVSAMSELDAGDPTHAFDQVKDLVEKIREELPDIIPEEFPLGIVAKCHLGAPYEVHTLDVQHAIIQHYKQHHTLPDGLERARALANSEAYCFVEVYLTTLRAVKADGTVVTVEG